MWVPLQRSRGGGGGAHSPISFIFTLVSNSDGFFRPRKCSGPFFMVAGVGAAGLWAHYGAQVHPCACSSLGQVRRRSAPESCALLQLFRTGGENGAGPASSGPPSAAHTLPHTGEASRQHALSPYLRAAHVRAREGTNFPHSPPVTSGSTCVRACVCRGVYRCFLFVFYQFSLNGIVSIR